jgi:hypothetical protein
MSAQPSEPAGQYPRTELDGQDAVIIPLAALSRLEAIERLAPAGVVAAAEALQAEITADTERHRAWVAAGRPGARSHDDVMSELLAPSGGWHPGR